MAELVGRITVIQESRFRLASRTGQSYLLTLHHHADIDAQRLAQYRRDGCEVIVQYSGDPGLTTGIAQSVRLRD